MTALAPRKKPSAALRIAAIGTAIILCGGAVTFFYAARKGASERPGAGTADIAIAITERTCEPAEITVPAGKNSFLVTNRGQRALEWEILDGVMVVDERENIAPGLSRRLTTQLHPGEYAITCGQLSAPRGRLIVKASVDAGQQKLSLMDLVGPAAEYRVYLLEQTDALSDAIERLKAGQADSSQALAEAGAALLHLEPAVITEEAPRGSVAAIRAGLAEIARSGAPDPEAAILAKLQADAKELAETLFSRTILPDAMLGGAIRAAGSLANPVEAAAGASSGMAGIRKIVELLHPLTARLDPPLAAKTADDLRTAESRLTAGSMIGEQASGALAGDLAAIKARLSPDPVGKTP